MRDRQSARSKIYYKKNEMKTICLRVDYVSSSAFNAQLFNVCILFALNYLSLSPLFPDNVSVVPSFRCRCFRFIDFISFTAACSGSISSSSSTYMGPALTYESNDGHPFNITFYEPFKLCVTHSLSIPHKCWIALQPTTATAWCMRCMGELRELETTSCGARSGKFKFEPKINYICFRFWRKRTFQKWHKWAHNQLRARKTIDSRKCGILEHNTAARVQTDAGQKK